MSVSEALGAAWNSRDPAQVAALYSDDGVRHQFAHEEVRLEGRSAVEQMIGAIMTAVPDCTLEIRHTHPFDGGEVLDWTFRGTMQHDFGPIPGNGQSVDLLGCSSMTTRDGQIVEERVYWDAAHFLAGAGMLG